MKKEVKYFITAILAGALLGTLFFVNPELFQGRFQKFEKPQKDIVNTPNKPIKQTSEDSLSKLLELSKQNPHLYYLYRDNLDDFEENYKAGTFNNLEELVNREKTHWEIPETDEELIESSLEILKMININSINLNVDLPSALEGQTIELIIKDEKISTFVIKEEKIIPTEDNPNNEFVIRIEVSENAFLTLIKGEANFEYLVESGEIRIGRFNKQGIQSWQINWNPETQSYEAQSTSTPKIIFELNINE